MSNRRPALLLAAALASGCAAKLPRELREARDAYARASADPAATQKSPAKLYEAREALAMAERSFDHDGNTAETRDRAYIATRKAELATVLGRTEIQRERAAEAQAALRRSGEQKAAQAQRELAQTRTELEIERAESAVTHEMLEAERTRRAELERRVSQLTASLAEVASVKQDPRGTVVTLSGSVLFASGRAKLLPAATSRLGQVADALIAGDPDATFVVEGHTDSTGNAARNQKLSEARAVAVRDFLVEHGVPAERVEARGMGSSQPVADNATADGRANNRRVEIVIRPPT